MTAVSEAAPVAAHRSMSQVVTDTVQEFRDAVPECLIAALVDMSTGMLLAVDTLEEYPAEDLDLLAAATFDLLQGRTVAMIEGIFTTRGGDGHYFQEMLVNSDALVHLFLRSARNQDIVAVVVCRRTATIGMLLAQARIVLKQLDAGFGG